MAARKFPPIPYWHLLGVVLFFFVGILNMAIVSLLPTEWLFEYRLLDLQRLGLLTSIVLGHLFVTLAMYALHRASHESDFLWRGFYQLHR